MTPGTLYRGGCYPMRIDLNRLAPLLAASLLLSPKLLADGVAIPVFLRSGELGVADLRASGIGSGSATARTASGPLRVDASTLKTLPDGFFVTRQKDRPVLLQLMGGSLVDVHDFESRLVAAITGSPVPPARQVQVFSPTSALAAAGRSSGPGPRKSRPRPATQQAEAEAPRPHVASFNVIATAEGLIGGRTASGTIIGKWMKGAALPSRKGLQRKLTVTYERNNRSSKATVLDVGPWNTNDPYWETKNGRPQAETGRDRFGRRTNKAGIDLFNATWYDLLGLKSYDKHLIENTTGRVTWVFDN